VVWSDAKKVETEINFLIEQQSSLIISKYKLTLKEFEKIVSEEFQNIYLSDKYRTIIGSQEEYVELKNSVQAYEKITKQILNNIEDLYSFLYTVNPNFLIPY
jgi:hypothetical protein